MKRALVIFHSADLDGHTSAWVTGRSLTEAGYEIVYQPYDYGQPSEPIIELASHCECAYMVDVSFNTEFEMSLLEGAVNHNFWWIDHHEKVINDFSSVSGLMGLREVGRAACELCWEFFHRKSPIPEWLRLCGRYDVWDLNEPDAKPFQYGLRAYDLDVTNQKSRLVMKNLTNGNLDYKDIIVDGKKIYGAILAMCSESAKRSAFEVNLPFKESDYIYHALPFIAVNTNGRSSIQVESEFDPDRHYGMMAFFYDGPTSVWRFSLYHNDSSRRGFPLSEIARQLGGDNGGGHFNAAGFQLPVLPKWINQRAGE